MSAFAHKSVVCSPQRARLFTCTRSACKTTMPCNQEMHSTNLTFCCLLMCLHGRPALHLFGKIVV
eukprot:3416121-Amphidinium_carterae.1